MAEAISHQRLTPDLSAIKRLLEQYRTKPAVLEVLCNVEKLASRGALKVSFVKGLLIGQGWVELTVVADGH